MKTLPVEVANGVLRIPKDAQVPPKARLAVILLDEQDTISELHIMADAGGSFDFLREEPDLYSDADVLPERRNPRFGSRP